MKKKIFIILFSIFMITDFIYSVRLFYLSTDRTFSNDEQKRIKIESGSGIDSLRIRIYKINDLVKFYLSQDDFHRPKVKGRKIRYFTPDIVSDFIGYFRANIRGWARKEIPPRIRESMIKEYPDMSKSESENGIYPSKLVNILTDKNFSFVSESEYVLQDKKSDWNYNYVFMDNLNQGTYLVEGVSTDNVAYTVLNISDYGFLVKKGNNDLLIYTLRTDNSQPVGNIDLTVYDRFKKELAKAKTDSNGIVKLNIKENDLFIVGRSNDNTYTFFDPKYFPSNVRDNSVYMYTERPVYRGNDDVFFKGILRKYKDDQYNILNAEKNVKLEAVDPQGSMVYNSTAKSTNEGIFSDNFRLPKDAKAGRYLIIATIDNKKYEAEFKVEYYIKPEYAVIVESDKNIVTGGDKVRARISASYYYGDAVKNVKCKYSIYKTKYNEEAWQKDREKSFYLTEAEYEYSQMELIKTGELKLGDSGKSTLDIDTKKENYAYNYNIQVFVYKESGAPVSGNKNILIVPSNFKISIDTDKFVYLVNENAEISFFASDYENNPLARNFHVKISSEAPDKSENVFLVKDIASDKTGKNSINFKAAKPGFVKIAVTGIDENGNKVASEKYIWIGQEGASYNYKGGRINLSLDKSYYKIGDTAKLLVLSPVPDVKMLFTIEGDTFYNYSIEKLSSNSMLLSIPIRKNYLPNVYADASFIFGNELYSNTIKINVPPDDQFLKINITSDKDVYNPKSKGKFNIKVTDNNNNPVKNADLSIAVVDEKIYSISKEIAVDIRNYFYPNRRNNVLTWSSIGYRFYGYSMNANTELTRNLKKGSTGLAAFKDSETERKDFKDTALWISSLRTDDKGEANFDLDFPDNITKWRVTAVGASTDTKVGRATYNIVTKLNFFSDLVAPNVICLKDEAKIYSVVHNYTKEPLKTDFILTGDNISIENGQVNMIIEPGSEKTLEWSIKPVKTGDATLKFKTSNEKYTDAVVKKISVIPNSIQKIAIANKVISGSDYNVNLNLPDPVDQKLGDQILHVNLSHGYASVIIDTLPYLINYPYGCVEQTTSTFLPDIVASNAIKKFKISLGYKEKNLKDIINAGLSRLYGFQQQNGSWGWFNEERIDIFMTSYVLYALTLTKESGYGINDNVLKTGLDSLGNNISGTRNDLEKLYGLYVLSMNNKKIYSILDDMNKNMSRLDDYQLALLILTLINYDKRDDAIKAAEILKKRAKKEGNDKLYWGTEKTDNWYKDPVETTAWVIKAFTKIYNEKNIVSKVIGFFTEKENQEILKEAANWLAASQKGNRWKSTRDSSSAILALTDYIDSQDFNDEKSYNVKLNNFSIGQIKFNKNNFNSTIDFNIKDYPYQLKTTNMITIEGLKKNDRLFSAVYLNYNTTGDTISASSNNISIKRKYYILKENKIGDSIKYSIDKETKNIIKGNNFLVELEVVCQKPYEYVIVEDFIPSGCTFVKDFLIYNIDGVDKKYKTDFTEYRDNKINFFMARTDSARLYYVLSPVYKGKYKVIPGSVSLMYFPEIKGNTSDDGFVIE